MVDDQPMVCVIRTSDGSDKQYISRSQLNHSLVSS